MRGTCWPESRQGLPNTGPDPPHLLQHLAWSVPPEAGADLPAGGASTAQCRLTAHRLIPI